MVRLLAALTMLGASGCATLFADKATVVSIDSRPPGASVSIDGQSAGQTPVRLEIESSRARVVKISMGPESKTLILDTKLLVGWLLLDILFWPGIIVDAVTGNWYELSPAAVIAEFPAAAPPEAPAAQWESPPSSWPAMPPKPAGAPGSAPPAGSPPPSSTGPPGGP